MVSTDSNLKKYTSCNFSPKPLNIIFLDAIRDCLPKELISWIILFMEYSTKVNIRATNRYWLASVHLDEFKIYFANDKNLPVIAQHFAKYYANKPIGLMLKKIVSPVYHQLPLHHLARLTQLTSLEVDLGFGLLRWVNESSMLYRLTNLQRLPEMKVNGALQNLTTLELSFSDPEELVCVPLYTNLCQLNIQQFSSNVDPFKLLGNPSRLTSLEANLGNMKLTESGWNTMTQLNNLKVLNLRYNFQELLPSFRHLTSLEKLCAGSGVRNDVFTLTQLTYLSLGFPHFRFKFNESLDLQRILKLCRLKVLRLIGDKKYITDLTFISHLTNLEDFQTNTNTVTLETIKNLNSKKLTRLEVAGITEEFVGDNINLPTLLELQVSGTTNYPDYLRGFSVKNLTSLIISFSAITDSLYALGNLKSLKISMSESNADLSLKNFPNLESLTITTTNVPTRTYDSLQYLTRLTHLEFKLTAEVFNSNPTALAKLSLRTLIFTNRFTAPGLWSVLTQLRDLEHLQVWRVDSEEIIESFSVLTNLTHLTMKKMKLTNHIRGIHLTKLTSLQELTFRAHPRKYYARLPPDYLMQKGLTRLYKLILH